MHLSMKLQSAIWGELRQKVTDAFYEQMQSSKEGKGLTRSDI